ncbi:MAG: radical SAM protein [Oligoflexia bacterium]|nr:radical SAM protein [Oligoflexia bacterium]
MRVSINPSYYCNFRCSFCYLGTAALADPARIGIDRLRDRLREISSYKALTGVDLYGGEIGLLKAPYFEELLSTVSEFYEGPVDVTTNLSVVRDFFNSERITLAVSYDGDAREKHEQVIENMRQLKRPFRVLMLSSPRLIEKNPDSLIELLNTFERLESVEIKPYSKNQWNQLPMRWSDQEDWVKRWIESSVRKNFLFMNEVNIRECLSGVYNAYSNDHLYITPRGELAVLDFDSQDREYFRPLRDIAEYMHWCYEEKEKAGKNPFCNECEYLGHCLTEHLRDVQSLEHSCNGGKQLLDWYQTAAVR